MCACVWLAACACERTSSIVVVVDVGGLDVCGLFRLRRTCPSTGTGTNTSATSISLALRGHTLTILILVSSWRRLHHGFHVVRHLDVVALCATALNAQVPEAYSPKSSAQRRPNAQRPGCRRWRGKTAGDGGCVVDARGLLRVAPVKRLSWSLCWF